MTTDSHLLEAASPDPVESLNASQKEALIRAVAKIVALGERTGVSTDEMIQLLQSGFTVGELLDYLTARSGDVS